MMVGLRKPGAELRVGDLVMWYGKPSDYASFQRRVVYQVVERIEPSQDEGRQAQYRYRPVFDLENPIGVPTEPTCLMSSREMKQIRLIDLGMMRMLFDSFIRTWIADQGSPEATDDGG
jgi:hypothetical protein